MILTVSTLTPEHHGLRARVALADDSREGVLSFQTNPSYRLHVAHWWLIVPSALHHFTHDALSLQWAGSARVNIVASEAAA